MTRRDQIHAALARAKARGVVDDYYCQSGMPGLRWTVWGQLIGAYVYGTADTPCERSYDTAEIEKVLRFGGLL
jgi:hypothetical protein